MVSQYDFAVVKDFLSDCLQNAHTARDLEELDMKVEVYIEQIFSDNGLSLSTKEEICLQYFGHSINKIKDLVSELKDIETGDILASCRLPYVNSLNDYERTLYFSIIDGYCPHTEKCDCRLIMPHRYKGEEWEDVYENISEICKDTTELMFLRVDKLEKNLGIRPGLIGNSICRGVKIGWKTYFYQHIRKNMYVQRASVNNGKIYYYLPN